MVAITANGTREIIPWFATIAEGGSTKKNADSGPATGVQTGTISTVDVFGRERSSIDASFSLQSKVLWRNRGQPGGNFLFRYIILLKQ